MLEQASARSCLEAGPLAAAEQLESAIVWRHSRQSHAMAAMPSCQCSGAVQELECTANDVKMSRMSGDSNQKLDTELELPDYNCTVQR